MKDLLLTDAEIHDLYMLKEKYNSQQDFGKVVAQAELDHLVELGIIYVQENIECPHWQDGKYIGCNIQECKKVIKCKSIDSEFIPLADYMKGDGE